MAPSSARQARLTVCARLYRTSARTGAGDIVSGVKRSVGQLNADLTGHGNGAILDKPFTPLALLEKVRAALSAPPTR